MGAKRPASKSRARKRPPPRAKVRRSAAPAKKVSRAREEATARQQLAATAEILKVISESPTDAQPVFKKILAAAVRLCHAAEGAVFRFDGNLIHLAGTHNWSRKALKTRVPLFPRPPNPDVITDQVILSADVVRLADGLNSPHESQRAMAVAGGWRRMLGVPMLREGASIGAIVLAWPEPGKTPDQQVKLLQTFADQAVIAIENVRLFNETREALERQTATAEVLQVISSSVADTAPVFEKIIQSCQRLFRSGHAGIALIGDDGLMHLTQGIDTMNSADERIRTVARRIQAEFPRPVRDSIQGYAIHKRKVLHYPDVQHGADVPKGLRRSTELAGNHSVLFAPMLWEDKGIGAMQVVRNPPEPFTDKDISLLKTFADQAVIAIQNARLFNETREALERQTATAEILRVISGSPTDVQPVFAAIAQTAHRLFNRTVALQIVRDGALHIGALAGFSAEGIEKARSVYPMALKTSNRAVRAMREGKVLERTDVQAPGTPSVVVEIARASGFRSIVTVPLLRGEELLGQLSLNSEVVSPRLDEKQRDLLTTFADQAVIAIENVRLFNETKEALERQTATAEILRVISESPTDTQPVFNAIVQSGLKLFPGALVSVALRYGDMINAAAVAAPDPARVEAWQRTISRTLLAPNYMHGAALLDRRIVDIPDVADAPAEFLAGSQNFLTSGNRAITIMPMLRGDEAIGLLSVVRLVAGPLSDRQLGLLRTFADQAVIAIENVRLFNETKEALERQTATAEILKVISGSPTDVQPVFEAIVASAARLCDAEFSALARFDEGQLHLVAVSNMSAEEAAAYHSLFPRPPGRHFIMGRAFVEGRPVHVEDIEADADYDPQTFTVLQRAGTYRSYLGIPILRDGVPIGAIGCGRREIKPFTAAQIELVTTFADQAVIAIENVRLFNETKEALERQTATAEILQVISSSPTDVQPVFDAIVRAAVRLCDGRLSTVLRFDGEFLDLAAHHNLGAEGIETYRRVYPARVSRDTVAGCAFLDRTVINVADAQDEATVPSRSRALAVAGGFRGVLVVPMLREGEPIGIINVARADSGQFSQAQVDLLETFADQAVIAIENVRLFKELESRTEALTRSVGQLTALGEVSQAISSTLDLEQVLPTIVSRAVQLTGLDGGSIYEYDEQAEVFLLRATVNVDADYLAVLRRTPIRKGEGAVGRAALTGEPVQITDVLDASYQTPLREALIRAGYRAVLVVPLRREEHVIGALAVTRKTPGAFPPEIVELLKTFATQSALAIQNARLFREIEDKGRQLEEASQHKSHFLASMSHELRTPLNAILGFNEMIIDQVYGEVPADVMAPLENIQTSGKHLLRLINNVLDLAKIEAGRMELALADYVVNDVVESVRSTLQPLAAEKGLEFAAMLPDDLPLAYGDFGRITQCLMNLAGNSLKFTKSGSVTVVVEQNGGTLVYRVADTGIGIPPDKIDTLFTEFKQTDATIASEYGGTGLGLSITKQFIEMHGGRIWVESELGRGSTFIFEIPLRVNEGAEA